MKKIRGLRRFPTKAELIAMQSLRKKNSELANNQSPRRFPTRVELEAARTAVSFTSQPNDIHITELRKEDFEGAANDDYLIDYFNSGVVMDSQINWRALSSRSRNALVRALNDLGKPEVAQKLWFKLTEISLLQLGHLRSQRGVGLSTLINLIRELQELSMPSQFGSETIEIQDGEMGIWKSLSVSHQYEEVLIPWTHLSRQSMFTLQRIFDKSDVSDQELMHGFTFRHLQQLNMFNLKDARNVGKLRLKKLVEELKLLFHGDSKLLLDSHKDIELREAMADETSLEDNLLAAFLTTQDLKVFDQLFLTLIELFVFSEKQHLDIILHRADWSPYEKSTLDEIGKRFGLTRERIRQIENRLKKRSFPISDDIKTLDLITQIFITSANFGEFQDQLSDFAPIYEFSKSPQRFIELSKFLGKESMAETQAKRVEIWEQKDRESTIAKNEIHTFRNQLGLIDLFATSVSLGIGEETLFRMIMEVYPRSLRENSLVLARTKNLNTIIESTIYHQLAVKSQLAVSEIKTGIQRAARYRRQDILGHPEDLDELIIRLAGNPCSIDQIKGQLITYPSISPHETWLISQFESSPTGILHRDELIEIAISDGIAIGSINQYLSSSPILRNHGPGIYMLVGKHADQITLTEYRNKVMSEKQSSTHCIVKSNDGFRFAITPNVAILGSGTLISTSQERKFFGNRVFIATCDCGKLISNQKIRITNDGFFTGLSSVLHHGVTYHTFRSGELFSLYIDEERLRLNLKLNQHSQ